MSARVLVLGGDGMLGRMVRIHLGTVPELALDWTSRRKGASSLLFRAESPRSLVDLARQSDGFDFVINCIATLRNVPADLKSEGTAEENFVNAIFPHQLAQVTAELGAKLVHVSTDAVFAPTAGRCRVSDRPEPADNYGRMKLLGEPLAANSLTLRCTIIGPNPIKKTGLFEWVLNQPADALIKGYEDHLWNGATTLQFAKLCEAVFQDDRFAQLREEGPVHHFCPNEAVTKYELVQMLCQRFRPDLQVGRASGGTVNRVLEMGKMLRRICGPAGPMTIAIDELSTYIDGPKAARD